MLRTFLPTVVLCALSASFALAQDTDLDMSAIDEINERYEKEYERIQREAAELAGFDVNDVEAITGKKLEITSKLVTIAFDTPSVDMRIQEMKFHVAQTTMKLRTMSFDIPEFIWGTTSIGPVKLDLPKIYSKRVEIKTKIPEFRWDVTSIKTKIPEFYMHRQEIKFDIPEFKLVDVSDEISDIENKAEALEAESSKIEAAHKGELRQATELSFIKIEAELTHQMELADERFVEALTEIDLAIEQVEYYGIDPRKVRNEDGTFTNLFESKATIQTERDSVRDQFEVAIQDVQRQRDEAISALETEEG